MFRAVTNSTSLAHLFSIGQFPLLRETFDQVCIPPAVWRELVDGARHEGRARVVREAAAEGWLRVVAPRDAGLVGSLQGDLPESDAQAIALAVQEKPEAVLFDRDSVIGLLIQAKQQGRVSVLRELLVRLRQAAGAHQDDRMDRDALVAVGEA